MSLRREIESSLEEAERDLDTPVVSYRGKALPCIPMFERRGVLVDVGGNPLEVQFGIRIRREFFITGDSTQTTGDTESWTGDSDLPAPCSGQKGRDIMTYLGRDYRVLTVARSPDGSHFVIDFGDPDSGM